MQKNSSAWSKGNPATISEAKKRWAKKNYEQNKEKSIAATMAWKSKNRIKVLEASRKYSMLLTDGYVRNRLAERCSLSAGEIPQCLVDIERERLRILRALKEIGYEKC